MPADTSEKVAPPAEQFAGGVVIRSTGSWYDVQAGGRVVPSKVRGKFRLEEQDLTNPVAVGDQVTIRLNPDDTGLITAIHARTWTRVARRRSSDSARPTPRSRGRGHA